LSLEEIPSIVRTTNVVPAGMIAALTHDTAIKRPARGARKARIGFVI
jgi:hypothetical protein